MLHLLNYQFLIGLNKNFKVSISNRKLSAIFFRISLDFKLSLNRPTDAELQGEIALYALYDIDGILRYTGSDREACLAYAELLDINSDEYLLMDVPGSGKLDINHPLQKARHQAKSNN